MNLTFNLFTSAACVELLKDSHFIVLVFAEDLYSSFL